MHLALGSSFRSLLQWFVVLNKEMRKKHTKTPPPPPPSGNIIYYDNACGQTVRNTPYILESKYNFRVHGCRLQMQPVWFPVTPRLDGCYTRVICYCCKYFHTKVVWRGFRYVWSWRRYYITLLLYDLFPLLILAMAINSCCCSARGRHSL